MRHCPKRLTPKGKSKPFKRISKARKPKGFTATHPGHCLAFDSIERFHDGMRRYVITAIDLYSRYTFGIATPSHTSHAAKHFYDLLKTVFPYPIEYVLTDNGSEFMKHFDSAIKTEIKNHWHTYPKTPRMNAHCERYNRTLQEEFVDYHEDTLFYDLFQFNDQLIDYLIFYNGERPHFSLQLKSPIQFLVHNNHQCHMWWPHTWH
jgi:transposase InsO family protein